MDDLSRFVDGPSRYLGGEIGQVRKDPAAVDVRVCLAFPDVYEIGMSHQGSQILYHVLNREPWIYAERFYLPWLDLLASMRGAKRPGVTLETGTRLSAFDILGITLQYELTYTNVLAVLDLAHLPLRAADRPAAFPLVLGGGPCSANPEPVAPFFDAILVGDGEEAFPEIARVVGEAKRGGADKAALLSALAAIDGVYVPSFHEPRYDADGRYRATVPLSGAPERITRRIVADLDAAPYPDLPLVPFRETVHDRLALEIARGCTRGCRFCQAGMVYRPVRERSPRRLLDLLEQSLAATGHGDVSLLSLSTGDYTCIGPLVAEVVRRVEGRRVALSLPSLRVESVGPELVEAIRRVRKTGFTLAPEAGTEALRARMNKPIADAELLSIAHAIYGAGWDLLKLYFMVGLPFETDDDRTAIADLARRVRDAGARGRRPNRLHVSLSPFVPKAHTPFQWVPQIAADEARARLARVREALRDRRILAKAQDPEMSRIEAFLARGDRRAADVIERAFLAGGVYDGWTDGFDAARWQRASEEAGVSITSVTEAARTPGDPLPWSHIDSRVDPEFLAAEWDRATRGEPTPDCRVDGCQGCGVCGDVVTMSLATAFEPGPPLPSPEPDAGVRYRVRLTYPKRGPARLLGHHELVRAFERAFRRAGLPLAHSGGFHPTPRLLFGPPLGHGIESDGEILDAILARVVDPREVREKLAGALPLGLAPTDVAVVDPRADAPFEAIASFKYYCEAPGALPADVAERLARFAAEGRALTVDRKGKTREFDAREVVLDARQVDDRRIALRLAHRPSGSLRPRLALCAVLGLSADEAESWRLTKVETTMRAPRPGAA